MIEVFQQHGLMGLVVGSLVCMIFYLMKMVERITDKFGKQIKSLEDYLRSRQ